MDIVIWVSWLSSLGFLSVFLLFFFGAARHTGGQYPLISILTPSFFLLCID